jgi:glycosyltransferase involved in cell wall biosynthesis
MRILVVSTLFPPVAVGGYEVECAAVVEHLRARHDVLVLTSSLDRAHIEETAGEGAPEVRRELVGLTPDARGALRAPLASLRAVESARRALGWEPDLIYVWKGASIPQASLRVLADSGRPLAFRVCEHWFGELFVGDQFLRELLPARRSPARAAWAAGCRALNRRRALRLRPDAPLRAAVSWNSQALRRMVEVPRFVDTTLERVGHSVPRYGDLYAAVVRAPSPEPVIVFLGRVDARKGVEVALEALALLASEHGIHASLSILGPEEPGYAADMRRLAERLGIATALRWRGQVSPEEITSELSRAHALIVPSVWQEPFPLVTIEGALARVPLVASDVGGIGEGMHDEEHALLFPPGDARAAAAALARVLEEPQKTTARVERALARAQEFRLAPYLEQQERFAIDALAAAGHRP